MEGQTSLIEFEISESGFFLSHASTVAECTIKLLDMFPRSDGSVLEYLSIAGADTDEVVSLIQGAEGIRTVRVLDSEGDELLLEAVSETTVATTLADHESVFTEAVVDTGKGTLKAEIPAHIDTNAVIDAFLEQYPGASLVRRTTVEQSSPTMTSAQYRERLLEPLTERQMEVLTMAHAAGYFEWPRKTTTEEIAENLDIASSTVSQHLRIAIGKVLSGMLTGKPSSRFDD